MITPQDIKDRLDELVREKFPGEQVYIDRVPDSFQRPSNHIALVQCAGNAEMASGIVELRPVFTLNTFAETDAYGYCESRTLSLRQMVLTGIFLPGCLRVKDRAPKVKALEMKQGTDFSSVTVTFSITLDRNDFMELEALPAAEHVAAAFRLSNE